MKFLFFIDWVIDWVIVYYLIWLFWGIRRNMRLGRSFSYSLTCISFDLPVVGRIFNWW